MIDFFQEQCIELKWKNIEKQHAVVTIHSEFLQLSFVHCNQTSLSHTVLPVVVVVAKLLSVVVV